MVQYCLEILAHGAEPLRSDVERVIDEIPVGGRAQVDGPTQVLDVEQLVEVVARAQQREVPALIGPVVEELEHSEALRPDEALGAEDGDAHASGAKRQAYLFRLDLGLAVRAHALQAIVLVDRVVIRDAVDGGR